MNDRELKAWRCEGGHVLGQVVRDGSGVRQLLLYRHAVYTVEEGEGERDKSRCTEVEVFAIVEGYVADVRCDLCGRMRTWVPGEEALRRLFERSKLTTNNTNEHE